MSTISVFTQLVSVADYLEGEARSLVKHEYLAGMVYAMAGASEPHNRIAMSLTGTLYTRLRGRRCEAFGSDMKFLCKKPEGDSYFYYPDAMIACDPTDSGHGWRERPTVVFEILSEETRSVDEREKRVAYKSAPTLAAYVLIEQAKVEVIVERRTATGWTRDVLSGRDAVLSLPEAGVEIPLAELYERIP